MSSEDKAQEKEKLRLAGASDVPAPPASPGAFTVGSPRSPGTEKFKNLLRNRDKMNDGSAPFAANNGSGDAELVEAEVAKDLDVEALIDERLQKMVIATAEVKRQEEEEDDDVEDEDEENNGNDNGNKRNICIIAILVGLLIVAGAVVATVALLRPSEPKPVTTEGGGSNPKPSLAGPITPTFSPTGNQGSPTGESPGQSTPPLPSPSKAPAIPLMASPTLVPTDATAPNPTPIPTLAPVPDSTQFPTPNPTRIPTLAPIPDPTQSPTPNPTPIPTLAPIPDPTQSPAPNPTLSPVAVATLAPTKSPTTNPTKSQTLAPVPDPTQSPTPKPTPSPTRSPTTPAPTELVQCEVGNRTPFQSKIELSVEIAFYAATNGADFRQRTKYGYPINCWDVSQVTDMTELFSGKGTFNADISGWHVSQVKAMDRMFANAKSFNQPLDSWDVSGVETMDQMFENAQSFNQPLSSWRVQALTSAKAIFQGATSFSQDLCAWIDYLPPWFGTAQINNGFANTNCPVKTDPVCSIFGCQGPLCFACPT